MKESIQVSVIVPIFNSCENIKELCTKVEASLSELCKHHEIILINDGSTDGSWEEIKKMVPSSNSLKAINLSRNFGQDNAIMAGLREAKGACLIIMDDDLQHDPKDFKLLLEGIDENYDVCFGKFKERNDSFFKKLASSFNDLCANLLIGKPKDLYLSPFKSLNRVIRDEIVLYEGPYPYVDGLILQSTNKICQKNVSHRSRHSGNSSYTLASSAAVWLRLATNFSLLPLRISTFIGLLTSLIAFLLGCFFLFEYFYIKTSPEGWQSTILILLFFGGIQLLSLGVIGEYLGRLFIFHNKRAQYLVKDKIHSLNQSED